MRIFKPRIPHLIFMHPYIIQNSLLPIQKQYLVTNIIETESDCKTSAEPLGRGFAAKVKAYNPCNKSSNPVDFHRLFWLLLN